MTTIQRLGIQGIRSYGPDPERVAVASARATACCTFSGLRRAQTTRGAVPRSTHAQLPCLRSRACRAQSIAFTPPLTLIVGSNGCGKTTVIEVSITPGAPVKASWGSCNTRWCGVHTVSWRV